MNVSWDDLKTILAVVRGNSLASAAGLLGVNYTTVARRISRAEQESGQIFFERLPDGYRPTEAGLLAAQHAAQMEESDLAFQRELTGRDDTLGGQLTITAPQLLIACFLSPVLEKFCSAHPKVDLTVRATNDILDLSRREADLAIRISNDPGDTLTGLRLATQHNASFATQKWADQISTTPTAPIDWIVYSHHSILPKAVTNRSPSSRVKYKFDDMVAMIGAAEAGLGVVRAPLFLGRTNPKLVQVPLLDPVPYLDVWAVAHPDVWPSAKLHAFRQFLADHFKANQNLFVAG